MGWWCCFRYELGGTPLPFASDGTFDLLFPAPPAAAITTVTKAVFDAAPMSSQTAQGRQQQQRRTYDPSAVPRCPHCGGKRVFECQLMPNLINVLRQQGEGEGKGKGMSDEERKAEVMRALKGGNGGANASGKLGIGMEWGTCLVFSCEGDCSEGESGAWREEMVYVQWDV